MLKCLQIVSKQKTYETEIYQ